MTKQEWVEKELISKGFTSNDDTIQSDDRGVWVGDGAECEPLFIFKHGTNKLYYIDCIDSTLDDLKELIEIAEQYKNMEE